MKILFTGATSLAGRLLYSRLLDTGHEVIAVSRQRMPGSIAVDLADPDMARKLPDEKFDALIHFAAAVPLNEGTSTWAECAPATVYGTVELLKWAQGRVGRILLASSCAIYGRTKVFTPTTEDHPLRPDTAYALSKYVQEQLVTSFCRGNCIPHAVMRLGYVYGPGMNPSRAIIRILQNVVTGKPITLVNAATEGLHLIHVEDIAEIGLFLLNEGSDIYNATPDRHISLREYVSCVADVLGKSVEVIEKNDPEARINNHYMAERLRKIRGTGLKVSLMHGVETLVKEFAHG